MQQKWNPLEEKEVDRLNLRASSPHSLGCRATPGRGAAKDWTRDIGDDGGVMELSERESMVPVQESEQPRDEIGRRLEPDSLF